MKTSTILKRAAALYEEWEITEKVHRGAYLSKSLELAGDEEDVAWEYMTEMGLTRFVSSDFATEKIIALNFAYHLAKSEGL